MLKERDARQAKSKIKPNFNSIKVRDEALK